MSDRDQILLGVVAVVAAVGAFFFFALKPKRAEQKEIKAQLTEQVEKRDELQSRVTAGRAAQEKFAESYGEVARLGKAVPPNDQTPSLLYQLEQTAQAQNVEFNAMEVRNTGATAPATSVDGSQAAAAVAPPGSQVGPAGFPTMPFNFSFEGSFFSIERFLSAVERYTTTTGDDIKVRGRLLTVDGVAIVEATRGGFPRVQAAFAATAYVLPPDEGLTAGASATGPAAAGAPGSTASSGTTATPTNAGVSP